MTPCVNVDGVVCGKGGEEKSIFASFSAGREGGVVGVNVERFTVEGGADEVNITQVEEGGVAGCGAVHFYGGVGAEMCCGRNIINVVRSTEVNSGVVCGIDGGLGDVEADAVGRDSEVAGAFGSSIAGEVKGRHSKSPLYRVDGASVLPGVLSGIVVEWFWNGSSGHSSGLFL